MKPLHKLDAVAGTLEAFADKHPGMAAREAATDARELHTQVAALVEAARQIPRAVTMRGPADTTAYLISDARMNALRDALAPFREEA